MKCTTLRGFHSRIKVPYYIGDKPIAKSTHAIYRIYGRNHRPLPFIAKIVGLHPDEVMSEVNVQQIAANHGLSPDIVDLLQCSLGVAIVMEYIHGITLKDYVRMYNVVKRRDIPEVIWSEIVRIFDRLYDLGINHMDKHDDNIILTPHRIYVIDFGDIELYNRSVPHRKRDYRILLHTGRGMGGVKYVDMRKRSKRSLERERNKERSMMISIQERVHMEQEKRLKERLAKLRSRRFGRKLKWLA